MKMAKAQQASCTIRKAETVSITLTQAGRCSVLMDGRTVLVVRKVTIVLQAYVHPTPAASGRE